jgi:hypothetical protein
VTYKSIGVILFLIAALSLRSPAYSQQSTGADVAAYQLGVVAEVLPGADLTYVITLTNHGPATVNAFYVLDGWTVNADGVSGFAAPIADPDFGAFSLEGKWEQQRPDQTVLAWLLKGDLKPGDTIRFSWGVRVDDAYRGGLINWARIVVNGELSGAWQPQDSTTLAVPPALANAADPIPENNRTTDGVTVVTDQPSQAGVDLALYQTGLVTQLQAGNPLDSIWLVTNRGPEVVKTFYVLAGWSLNADGGSILTQPVTEPDFGAFKVVGRWQQMRADEELWLWQLEGDLASGDNAAFTWSRKITPDYRGDLVNWARVFTREAPNGQWVAREGTTSVPQALQNDADVVPDNDRSLDGLTTITE